MNTTLQARLSKPRCDNPFDDDYLWYLAAKDKRDWESLNYLTNKQKRELRNKAIVFLSRHRFLRKEVGFLFNLTDTMISTIISQAPDRKSFVSGRTYKMTQETADELRENFALGITPKELSEMYDCCLATVSEIINNKRWVKKAEDAAKKTYCQ